MELNEIELEIQVSSWFLMKNSIQLYHYIGQSQILKWQHGFILPLERKKFSYGVSIGLFFLQSMMQSRDHKKSTEVCLWWCETIFEA